VHEAEGEGGAADSGEEAALMRALLPRYRAQLAAGCGLASCNNTPGGCVAARARAGTSALAGADADAVLARLVADAVEGRLAVCVRENARFVLAADAVSGGGGGGTGGGGGGGGSGATAHRFGPSVTAEGLQDAPISVPAVVLRPAPPRAPAAKKRGGIGGDFFP
jgi:hypothetical protein